MDAFYKPIWLKKDPSLNTTSVKEKALKALSTFKMSA